MVMTRRNRGYRIVPSRLLGSAALLLLTTAVYAAQSAPARPRNHKIVLKLGHVLPATHPVHASMEFMARRLLELSAGAVELQVFGGGQLGSEPELIDQARRGTLAIAKSSAGALEELAPEMAIFGMPYLFRDDQHYWNVLLGDIGTEILRALEAHGLHGVCYYDAGGRSFYTVRRPILEPGDVRGLKLRVMSQNAGQMITTLGGIPNVIAYGDVYAALQQGTIDGAENNPPSFLASRHYEIAKHYELDEHTRVPDVLVFSQKVWEDLTPQVRAWIEQAAADSVSFQRKLWRVQTEEALQEIQKAGVAVYRPDKSAFAAAMAPMYTKADGTRLGELARRIMVAD
jgi:tripartite ATP-independent transporter DctP family solute receptor